jgi:hypothetical protein
MPAKPRMEPSEQEVLSAYGPELLAEDGWSECRGRLTLTTRRLFWAPQWVCLGPRPKPVDIPLVDVEGCELSRRRFSPSLLVVRTRQGNVSFLWLDWIGPTSLKKRTWLEAIEGEVLKVRGSSAQ